MAIDACPGVIVSANRSTDVWPYATHIYASKPQVWGCVMPWEFPQNGTREQEETFLRDFFSDTEIHMQGGADGEGRGFMFLKQVWYAIAIWNLEVRIPAVEKWYWQQDANLALLNDADMQSFLLSEGSKPSVYFDGKELEMYGESFLVQVTPRIRLTAREYLARQQRGEPVDIVVISEQLTKMINEDLHSRAKPRDRQDRSSSAEAANMSSPRDLPDFPVYASAPPMNSNRLDDRRHFIDGHMSNREDPMRPSKRAGSGSYRGRGAPYHIRSKMPFDGRDLQQYSSPTGGVPAIPVQMMRRDRSSGQADFVPPPPYDHPFSQTHYPIHNGSRYHHTDPYNHTSQNGMPYPPPHHEGSNPAYYSKDALSDYGSAPFTDRTNNGDMMYPVFDSNDTRWGARHSSINGRTRGGSGSLHGRCGRGRNSFGASDHAMRAVVEDESNFVPPGTFKSNNYMSKGRRLSGLSDNWRIGAGQTLMHSSAPGNKENVGPRREFSGSDFAAPQRHDSRMGMAFSPEQEHGHVHPIASQSFQPQKVPPPFQEVASATSASDVANTCGQYWISPQCTFATKLISWGVPPDVPEDRMLDFFRQYGPVQNARRFVSASMTSAERPRPTMVFLTFANAHAARAFLENSPTVWADGRKLNVEVAKEFWDPTHKAYQKRVRSNTILEKQWPQVVERSEDIVATPTILRRNQNEAVVTGTGSFPGIFNKEPQTIAELPSEETTPCPSLMGTPKKKKNKKSKNKGEQAKKDDLRKIWSTANAEQLAQGVHQGHNAAQCSLASAVESPLQAEVDRKPGNTVQTTKPVISNTTQLAADSTTPSSTDVQPSSGPTSFPPKTSKTHSLISGQPSSKVQQLLYVKDEDGSHADEACDSMPAADEELICIQQSGNDNNGSFRKRASHQKETPQTTTKDDIPTSVIAPRPTDTAIASPPQPSSVNEMEGSVSDGRLLSTVDAQDAGDQGAATTQGEESAASLLSESARGTETITTSSATLPAVPEVATEGSSSDIVAMTASGQPAADPTIEKRRFDIPTQIITTNVAQTEGSPIAESALAPPTPAFLTAPNTPAIGLESSIVEPTKDDPAKAKQPEKSDKAKGPAQTESLSLFGRKKDKKPKAVKKSSLKGKPSMDDKRISAASRSMSLAVSGIIVPSNQGSSQSETQAEKKASQEKLGVAFAAKLSNSTKRSQSKDEVQPAQSNESADQTQANVEDSPTKRKGKIGNMISNLFGGGAHLQAPEFCDTSLDSPASEAVLTGSKAQDHLLKSEIKESAIETDVGDDGGLDNRGAETVTKETGGSVVEQLIHTPVQDDSHGPPDYIDHKSDISDSWNASMGALHEVDVLASESRGSKKKRKKKGKATQVSQESEATPSILSISMLESKPKMFRFGQDEPELIEFDTSLASSVAQGGDMDSLSPTSTNNPRKRLPPKSGHGHLMQPKQHAWMLNKKRPLGGRATASDFDIELDREEEAELIKKLGTQKEDGSDDTEESRGVATPPASDASSHDTSPGITVYIGPARRSEIRVGGLDERVLEERGLDEPEPEEKTTEEMRGLVNAELKRKLSNGVFISIDHPGNGEAMLGLSDDDAMA